ncbi:MAG: NTP transferase domain-containing protein [Deltaproteobacteria bacterium]|nr:NTP transferase domain-containing protein [Deltaproteobacteria bacterium]
MPSESIIASLIFAAGKGSRMKNYHGNKTLLPLEPDQSPFEGTHPILLHILENLPPGPSALVINHKKEDVIAATRNLGIQYFEQPELNGTGGALLASKSFILDRDYDRLIITMGDVPFVKSSTYMGLTEALDYYPMVVLGFTPDDKKQYGVLEIMDDHVIRVTEWKYWSAYSKEKQDQLQICNSGIYAARRDVLAGYIHILEKKPHTVLKERNGRMVTIEEFFITDLIELMNDDGLKIGYTIAEDEIEVMGIDDLTSLIKAQKLLNA